MVKQKVNQGSPFVPPESAFYFTMSAAASNVLCPQSVDIDQRGFASTFLTPTPSTGALALSTLPPIVPWDPPPHSPHHKHNWEEASGNKSLSVVLIWKHKTMLPVPECLWRFGGGARGYGRGNRVWLGMSANNQQPAHNELYIVFSQNNAANASN